MTMADALDWLLEEENPSVRYWALRDLLGLDEDAPEILETRLEIMNSKPVASILRTQNPAGYWVHEEDMYLPKYTATTHQLLLLAEMGATRTPMIEKAIEQVYRFQRNSGHFLTELPKSEKGRDSVVKDGCCFDGNILLYLNHYGYLEDPRTQKLLDFIYDYYDDVNTGWRCRAYPINPDAVFPVNCYMGATKILKAFSIIPPEKRSQRMKEIIARETEKILENRVYKYLRNTDGSRKDKHGWKRFGFPLFYQADLLEVMATLTRLGVHDDRMGDAVNIIRESQRDGRWLLKDSFNGKMWTDIEEKNKPSKWITLRAMYVLGQWEKILIQL
ncbi:MAG: nitrogen fixation protein NifH [Candidatus Bathyarchaeota archaeon]